MKQLIILICTYLICLESYAQTALQFEAPVKQRLFVLTDITYEPDDQESLVRLLVYSNEYDLEGIVATTSTHLRSQVRKDKIEQLVRNYGEVKANLDKHARGYPSMEYLLGITSEHLPLYSMEGVGQGKDSPGSELLIKAVDRNDDRALWVTAWGGANCLAQALWKVRETRDEEAVRKFVSKIRVYSISDQDFAGQWMRNNFQKLFYIVDPSAGDSWFEYYKTTWTGISGDRYYKNGPGMHHEQVDNPWLAENIRQNHGPLGANYLPFAYIMEGDTPSFLGLINNGLGWYISPAYGGWGGRYELYQSYAEKGKIWTSSVNTQDEILLPDGCKEASNQAIIWRWREAYPHDFAARMDWNIADEYKNANHNPIVSLNGNSDNAVARAKMKAGEKVQLSAEGSSDPDGNQLSYRWFIYPEACAFTGSLTLINANAKELAFAMPELKNGEELPVETRLRNGQLWGHGEPMHLSCISRFEGKVAGQIKNVQFNNINAIGEQGILLFGQKESPMETIRFNNVQLRMRKGIETMTYGGNFDLRSATPKAMQIFEHDIPGIYAQHANKLDLRDFNLSWGADLPSFFTHGIHCKDVTDLLIKGFTDSTNPNAPGRENVKLENSVLRKGQ